MTAFWPDLLTVHRTAVIFPRTESIMNPGSSGKCHGSLPPVKVFAHCRFSITGFRFSDRSFRGFWHGFLLTTRWIGVVIVREDAYLERSIRHFSAGLFSSLLAFPEPPLGFQSARLFGKC